MSTEKNIGALGQYEKTADAIGHYESPTLDSRQQSAKDDINPLRGIPKDSLMSHVENFCSTHGLNDHVDVFRRGALAAQNPDEYHSIPDFTADDKEVLDKSRANKWWQTRMLYFTGEADWLSS